MAVTLVNLRDAAKEFADQTGTGNPIDATWNRWINALIERLWRLVTTQQPDLFHATFDATLTGSQNTIAKPATLRTLRGVSRDPDSPSLRVALRKWNMNERERVSVGVANVAGTYRLYYTPGPTALSGDSDPMDTVLEPYREYVEIGAAIRALGREESETAPLRTELQDQLEEIEESIGSLDGAEPETIADTEDGVDRRPWSVLRVPTYRVLGANVVIR